MKLEKVIKDAVDTAIQRNIQKDELFDYFCRKIDDFAEEEGLTAYIRLFWCEQDTIAEAADEICEVIEEHGCSEYLHYPIEQYNACLSVILY